MSKFSVQYFEGAQGLQEIFDRWQALVEQLERPHFNQCPDWYAAYFDAVDEPLKITFCAAFAGDQLVGVLPLVAQTSALDKSKWRQMLIQRAKLPYGLDIYTSDLVVANHTDPADVWHSLAKHMRGGQYGWQVFNATNVPLSDYGLSKLFSPDASSSSFVRAKVFAHYKVIKLDTYENLWNGLTSKLRQQLRKGTKTLNELGEYEYRWFEGAAVPGAVKELIDLELKGWKGKPDQPKEGYYVPSAIGLEDWKERMYMSMAERFANRGQCRVLLMYLNKEVIGAQLSVKLGKSEFLLKCAIKEGFGNQISIGHLLVNLVAQRVDEDNQVSQQKVDELNLISDFSWPDKWRPEKRPYYNFQVYNKNLIGRLSALRSSLRRLPA